MKLRSALCLLMVMGLGACGEAPPTVETKAAVFTQTGPADPPSKFYANGTLLHNPYPYPAAMSTENPVKGHTVIRMVPVNLAISERTQGAAWNAVIRAYTSLPSDAHSMICATTMLYYEAHTSSPPLPKPPFPLADASFSGNQGYWVNQLPFACAGWRKTTIGLWRPVTFNVAAYGFLLFEMRDNLAPYAGIGLAGSMDAPEMGGTTWYQSYERY